VGIVFFKETNQFGEQMKLILNKTNGERLEKLFGTDDEKKWVGKKVTIHSEPHPRFNLVARVKLPDDKKYGSNA